jgi:hypothetical protein
MEDQPGRWIARRVYVPVDRIELLLRQAGELDPDTYRHSATFSLSLDFGDVAKQSTPSAPAIGTIRSDRDCPIPSGGLFGGDQPGPRSRHDARERDAGPPLARRHVLPGADDAGHVAAVGQDPGDEPRPSRPLCAHRTPETEAESDLASAHAAQERL